jgi:hypothetical protein
MKTKNMNFIEAVQAAKDGKTVRRAVWECQRLTIHNGFVYCMGEIGDHSKVEHILAEDWEIVPEPPKTMGFMEAWEQAKAGKKIARYIWDSGWYATLRSSLDFCETVLMLTYQNGDKVPITQYNIDATDWYVVEEDENND